MGYQANHPDPSSQNQDVTLLSPVITNDHYVHSGTAIISGHSPPWKSPQNKVPCKIRNVYLLYVGGSNKTEVWPCCLRWWRWHECRHSGIPWWRQWPPCAVDPTCRRLRRTCSSSTYIQHIHRSSTSAGSAASTTCCRCFKAKFHWDQFLVTSS